jgi:ElaB/YqjD/DUF883 family membrane-anchored ribosome-binding protein
METYFSNMTAGEGTKEKLVQDLMTLVNDAETLVKAAGGQLADKSKTELATALDRVKTSCRRMQDHAIAGARSADQVIREHPYQSIGVAFGIGLLIGVLVNRD